MGAEAAHRAAETADAARCGVGSADRQYHAVADHRSRPGRALRDPAIADRSDAGRCLWAAPGDAVLHATQRLPRDPRDYAIAAGRSAVAVEDLRQIAGYQSDDTVVDVRQIRHASCDLPVDQSPGAVSGGHAVVQPWARRGAWRCRRRDHPADGLDPYAVGDHRQLPGYRAGVSELAQDPALPDSGGAGGGLYHSGHAV